MKFEAYKAVLMLEPIYQIYSTVTEDKLKPQSTSIVLLLASFTAPV